MWGIGRDRTREPGVPAAPATATAGARGPRAPAPGQSPNPGLPDDTRLWAALITASGGLWGGCVRFRSFDKPRSRGPCPSQSPGHRLTAPMFGRPRAGAIRSRTTRPRHQRPRQSRANHHRMESPSPAPRIGHEAGAKVRQLLAEGGGRHQATAAAAAAACSNMDPGNSTRSITSPRSEADSDEATETHG
jgi:hypothetical protein